ncbi:MAG: cupin domain-containing protein [Actinomycetota bacterium]|nr:cupin domain-containing protein [Actinomycetota bacterium]
MYTRNKEEGPKRERSGLVSYILLQRGDLPKVGLMATWVEVAPGSRQRPHDHASEQVYVIVAGRGRMLVGEEEREVGAGDLVYIPSGAVHGIENASEEVLTYVSAATPALDAEAAYDTGQLRSEG